MRRVAEIMYIIPEERETFISDSVNPDEETRKMLWMCGVRNQQYFGMNDLIFMTFEYAVKLFNVSVSHRFRQFRTVIITLRG